MIRAATMKLYRIPGFPTDNLDPKRDGTRHMVFSYGCLVIYLIFYGTALIWVSSEAVADLFQKRGVWNDFEAKVNVPGALVLLTSCLRDFSPPGHYATVRDFSICLKDIGLDGGWDTNSTLRDEPA
jgi:hypothetical protein